jgi:hypothetical protein
MYFGNSWLGHRRYHWFDRRFFTQQAFLGGFSIAHALFSQNSAALYGGFVGTFKSAEELFLTGKTDVVRQPACYDNSMSILGVS